MQHVKRPVSEGRECFRLVHLQLCSKFSNPNAVHATDTMSYGRISLTGSVGNSLRAIQSSRVRTIRGKVLNIVDPLDVFLIVSTHATSFSSGFDAKKIVVHIWKPTYK